MSNADSRMPITSMTLVEQVCLALRVPRSGTEWLDELILKSIRLQFQHTQYNGLCRDSLPAEHVTYEPDNWIAAAWVEPGETDGEMGDTIE